MSSFDWRDFLATASALAANTGDEASLRSAISRAYYAVYNVALERASSHGVKIERIDGFNAHESCWFAYQSVPVMVPVGTGGTRLKQRRVQADYKQVSLNWATEAASAVLLAKQLIGQL